MNFDWATKDDSHAIHRGFPLYLTDDFVNGRLTVVYAMLPEGLARAKAAAEQGDETAKKALAILAHQRMKE